MNERIVTIDGPSASGKSTVARGVAARLGALYVDSGAVYRGVTWRLLREGCCTDDEDAVAASLEHMHFEFFARDGAVLFRVDGEEPGQALRTAEIDENVSRVAAVAEVRVFVVERLRAMRRFGFLVMEGRDIGTVVFPESPFKFYLDASPEERARRRHAENCGRRDEQPVEAVQASLGRRDRLDSTRKTDPLRIAADAVVLDSTSLTIDEVVDFILSHVA